MSSEVRMGNGSKIATEPAGGLAKTRRARWRAVWSCGNCSFHRFCDWMWRRGSQACSPRRRWRRNRRHRRYPKTFRTAAKTLLGSDAQVLLVGDLAKNGKRQFLAANVIPKTPKNNVPGTVVTRAVVAEEDGGKWTELLRCDEHLKNSKGYLGSTPLDSITGWRLQYRTECREGPAVIFHTAQGKWRHARAAGGSALEPADQALPIAGSTAMNIF